MPPPGFEWDPEKARTNVVKHAISFDRATDAFKDPNRISDFDRIDDNGEERLKLYAMLGMRIVIVSYCVRGDNIRIFSARKASKHEQETYLAR